MEYTTLMCEKEGRIRFIVLNRPRNLNAINYQMTEDLRTVMAEIAEDEEARCVILTGAGRGFCAGADVKDLSQPGAKRLPTDKRYTFFNQLEDLEKPVIAAVNGPCNGGGLELALCCDLRIASERATFGFGEVKLGAIPAGGGTARLPRLVGPAKAKELLYFGNSINAQEAHQMGLVNRVVPAMELMELSRLWASELAEKAPLSLKMIKSCVNQGLQMQLLDAIMFESKCALILSKSEDRREGLRAFTEKRKPLFKGF